MTLDNLAENHNINIAIIGLGMMGSISSHIFEQGTGRVVAAIGRTKKEVENYIRANKFPDLKLTGIFTDYEDLLKQTDVPINVVYVATPNCMHVEMGIKAAKAGKHILFEKPLATNESDAKEVLDACLENKIVAEINSQYRYTDVLNLQLRQIIKDGVLAITEKDKVEFGNALEVEMGYIQGWQTDPCMNIGWRPIVELAGKGKLTGDLGSHQIMTTHHLFGGNFTEFNGKRYNLHEHRDLVLSGTGVTFTEDTGSKGAQRVRMDDVKFSADDRAIANWKYKLPGGHEVNGVYRLSQVDPGNENHFYVSMKFEKGTVTWFQEHPNQLYYEKDGKTYVYERGSVPSTSGRPGGHSKGYGDMVLDETLNMIDTIRSGDEIQFEDFTRRTMGQANDTVAKVVQWNKPEMIYGKDSTNIVNPAMEYYRFIADHSPILREAPK